jgi:thioredoxin reductase
MAKRTKENITLGSGKAYIMEHDTTKGMPTTAEVCVAENLLGHIQGGAELSYTAEPHEETDDLGLVSKTVVNAEEAILKLGLLTWNGTTLKYLADRCTVTEGNGKRTIKIGGAGNAQGKEWVVCFFHEDKKDGNLWVMIRGNNTAGFTLTFAVDAGTKIEPEFKALPQDDAGTLITIEEETTEA